MRRIYVSIVMALLLVLVVAACSIAYGVEVSLSYDKSSSTIKLTLRGKPNENVNLNILIHGEIPASSNMIRLRVTGITIPTRENKISAVVTGVRKICPFVNMYGIWIGLPCTTSTRFSRGNIPPGKYDVELLLFPKSGTKEITYTIDAQVRLNLGPQGKMTLSYGVKNLHVEYVIVTCNGVTKKLIIASHRTTHKTSERTNSGSPQSSPVTASSSEEENRYTQPQYQSSTTQEESKLQLSIYRVSVKGLTVHVCVKAEREAVPVSFIYLNICLNSTCTYSETNSSGVACVDFTASREGLYLIKVRAQNEEVEKTVRVVLPSPKIELLNVSNGRELRLRLTNVTRGEEVQVSLGNKTKLTFKVNATGSINVTIPEANITGKITVRVLIGNTTLYVKTLVLGAATKRRPLMHSLERSGTESIPLHERRTETPRERQSRLAYEIGILLERALIRILTFFMI